MTDEKHDYSDHNTTFVPQSQQGSLRDDLQRHTDKNLGRKHIYLDDQQIAEYEQARNREFYEKAISGFPSETREMLRQQQQAATVPHEPQTFENIQWRTVNEEFGVKSGYLNLPNGLALNFVCSPSESTIHFAGVMRLKDHKRFEENELAALKELGVRFQGDYDRQKIDQLIELMHKVDENGKMPVNGNENSLTGNESIREEEHVPTLAEQAGETDLVKALEFTPVTEEEYNPYTGDPISEVAAAEFDNGYRLLIRRDDHQGYFIEVQNSENGYRAVTELAGRGVMAAGSDQELNQILKNAQRLDSEGFYKDQVPTERDKQLQLINACEAGDQKTVQNLINKGVNVNVNVVQVVLGDKFLQDSLLDKTNGNKEIQKILVKAGLDIEQAIARTRDCGDKNLAAPETILNRIRELQQIKQETMPEWEKVLISEKIAQVRQQKVERDKPQDAIEAIHQVLQEKGLVQESNLPVMPEPKGPKQEKGSKFTVYRHKNACRNHDR